MVANLAGVGGVEAQRQGAGGSGPEIVLQADAGGGLGGCRSGRIGNILLLVGGRIAGDVLIELGIEIAKIEVGDQAFG